MARTVRSIITGVEKFYPANVVTNQDIEKLVDTSDEWIQTRTGITQRYRVAKGEASSDLAVGAIGDSICLLLVRDLYLAYRSAINLFNPKNIKK
jgi:hypothetical protein